MEATEACCTIRVRDDGPGIPPHLLPNVFERFTRGDVSRARSGPADGGSGLGLAIVEAITEAHGGLIEVRSEPGHTEFAIVLPPAGRPALVSAGSDPAAQLPSPGLDRVAPFPSDAAQVTARESSARGRP